LLISWWHNRTDNGTVVPELKGEKMTYRQVIREIAQDQHGFITTTQAQKANVPPVELRKLASRGALENRGYGIYKITDAPTTEFDQFAEIVYRIGDGAFLAGETVLALHNLALVNPNKINVITTKRVRTKLPKFVKVTTGAVTPDETTTINGIPATTVERALRDCKAEIMPERFKAAVHEAKVNGYLTKAEALLLLGATKKRVK
jgi:predicted transcriptional regulator of viral defense system